MSERELAKYIPCYGDRVAVVAFCRKTQDSISNTDRKSNLFERLRKRVCTTSTKEEHRQHISKRYVGNSNAKKKSKRVELGWMNFSARENDFKQVRSAKGGGTRHVSMDVKSTVRDVQKIAEGLFFPNGKSKHLELKSLDCSIRDFSHRMVESEFTIEDLYEETKVKILRLYLFTKTNNRESTAENSDTNPEADVMFTEGAQDDGQSSSSSGIKECETIDLTTLEESEETSFMLHSPLYIMDQQISVMQTETVFDYMETENSDDIMQEQMAALIQETSENVNTVQEVWSQEAFNTNTPAQNVRIATDVEESPFEDSFDNVVTIGEGLSDVGNLEDTIPLEDPPKTIILVRRGQALCDLMQAFSDPALMDKEISIRMKLPNGQIEEGVGPGVFRDCLSEFWDEFYSRCALGTDVKVPFLRHEFQSNEWQAVGRILAKGWDAVKYFPIRLSLPFLEEALYGTTYSSV
ncbi:uncharacterized protein LOC130421158 [Triplophysa dalaica]|uniref:uncharacterized protein LOC130421158 n=1 Tax=Triplophysa dalaica TaxID=1582913 RepID=UPI0024E02D28|nr:uncharacterized protein LOC130421158 [Triplophysa dalaica]